MLTPKQDQKYWRTWARIMACQSTWANEPRSKQEQRRHALHTAFGLPESHTVWCNQDFSRFLARTAHLCEEVDIRDRDRENATWRIRQDAKAAGLSEEYLATISRDTFGAADWADLPTEQLLKFRNTIHNRAGSHAGHDTRTTPAQPRRQYTLDGGGRTFSPHVTSATPRSVTPKEKPKASRQLEATAGLMSGNGKATGSTAPIRKSPAVQPAGTSLKYCMHAVQPPSAAPAPALVPSVPSVPPDNNEPF